MLKCPVCNNVMNRNNQQFICENNHSFDIAKNGSVYLSTHHTHKERGDNKFQIEARHKFHQKDHYHLIKETLKQFLEEISFNSLLDLGCGEGYYTNYIAETFTEQNIYGLDLSKEAIHIASKQKRNVQYVIANNNDLPFIDHRIDVITALFTPLYLDEIKRVLKPYGYLITVQAGARHLLELKEELYENVILNEEKRIQDPKFKLIQSQRVSQRLHLDKESKNQLLEMTPYYYTSPKDKVSAFLKKDEFDVTIYAVVTIYQKQP